MTCSSCGYWEATDGDLCEPCVRFEDAEATRRTTELLDRRNEVREEAEAREDAAA